MRAVIQRVKSATCRVGGEVTGQIGPGLLVFVGIASNDTTGDVEWLARKIPQIRVFADAEELMNRSVVDISGGVLLISQFTLYGNLRKGTRPSFNRSAPPEMAVPLYEQLAEALGRNLGQPVQAGVFAADMQIDAHNDGPVTLILDTEDKRF